MCIRDRCMYNVYMNVVFIFTFYCTTMLGGKYLFFIISYKHNNCTTLNHKENQPTMDGSWHNAKVQKVSSGFLSSLKRRLILPFEKFHTVRSTTCFLSSSRLSIIIIISYFNIGNNF